MSKPAFPSDKSPLYGCFGQGRTEPEVIHLFNQWTRLSTDENGEMNGRPIEGFFCAETQFVTQYRIRLNGRPIYQRFSVQISPYQWSSLGTVYRSSDNENVSGGEIPVGSLELQILRSLDQGWLERLFIRNNSISSQKFKLEIEFAVQIGDLEYEEEMKRQQGPAKGTMKPSIHWNHSSADLQYCRFFGVHSHTPVEELRKIAGSKTPKDGDPVVRALRLRIDFPEIDGMHPTICTEEVTTIRIEGELPSRSEVRVVLIMEPQIDKNKLSLPLQIESFKSLPTEKPLYQMSDFPHINIGNSVLNLIFAQALMDIQSLRLDPFIYDGDNPSQFVGFTAGVPRYIGVFGRDILTVAWQSSLVAHHFLEPALNRIGGYQGKRVDTWRDEEPNRLPHELRLNAEAAIGRLNRYLYYGDVTSTPLWIITLMNAWHWTGDHELLKRQKEVLEKCCRWIADRLESGHGFIYYTPARPGERGENRNQAWKDSGDAIVDENGKVVLPPLAVTEIQGYAFQALLGAAELFDVLETSGKYSKSLRKMAAQLKAKFNREFWIPDENYLALALDHEGKQVRSIASNAGHCLGTGIIDEQRIGKLVRCLMSEDLFSGWGIRTLSSKNPAYDPFSYHRGTVWPVENATIAAGMALCGYSEEANQIIGAQLAAATLFEFMRLPETLSGHPRSDQFPTPSIYPYSNPIQAWSVSAIFMHLQTILGIRPDAPRNVVYVDPHLPEWIPWLELRDLTIGSSILDLRFERQQNKTQWSCSIKRGSIEVRAGDPMRNPEKRLPSRNRPRKTA